MPERKYTLTIFVAGAGTPLFNSDSTPKIDEHTGKQKTSGPGHVFYGISNDGGKTVTAYGFAPPDGSEKFDWYSPDKPGKVQPNEHKVYRKQVYRKTVAITEAQYKVLEDFGKNPKKYGFNEDIYNWNSRSCIDFVYAALNASNVYSTHSKDLYRNGQKIGTINTSEKAATKVLGNIPEFEKIPNTISRYPAGKNIDELMENVHKLMPERTFIQRYILTENQREQRHQYAQVSIDGDILKINDMPKTAQAIFHQCKQAFTDFCDKKNIAYDKNDVDKIAMSLTSACYANNMQDVSLININDNGKVSVGHRAPGLIMASVDMWEAAKTPVEESLSQIQQTAQRIEYEEQQKQIVQSQSHGARLS